MNPFVNLWEISWAMNINNNPKTKVLLLLPLKSQMCALVAIIMILSILSLALHCMATHPVRTLGKQNADIHISMGGPFFLDAGFPIPMPAIYLGTRYGVTEDVDMSVDYNITSPFIHGIGLNLITSVYWAPIQPGLRKQVSSPTQGPALLTGAGIIWISNFKDGLSIEPYIEMACGYRYKRFNPFAGVSIGFILDPSKYRFAPIHLNPYLGMEYIGTNHFSFGTRITLFDLLFNANKSMIHWWDVIENEENKSKWGAWGLSIGCSWKFKTHVKDL